MKQMKSMIPLLGIVATALIYYSFFFSNPPVLVPTIIDSATGKVKFVIQDLPQVSGASADIRIFISHGDGTYFMGTEQQLAAHVHQYGQDLTTVKYPAFAEVIALYDDNKKPPGRTALEQVGTGSTNGPVTTAPATLGNNKVELLSTTNPVPGDSITYIVTYEHPGNCNQPLDGTVRLTFDSNVFDFVQPDVYYSEGMGNQSSGTAITKEFSFTGLQPNEQRHLFVLLQTKETVDTLTPLGPPTNVELSYTRPDSSDACPALPVFVDTTISRMVLASHDPNYKIVVENALCPDEYVVWQINFQNEGNAAENNVVVADWIDPLLDFSSVQVLDASPVFPLTSIQQDAATREYKFVMQNANLRGLGESNVAEADTRGFIKLRANLQQFEACNAIANNARIYFGCNPPVTTETALAPLPCNNSCDSCTVKLDTLLGPVKIPVGGDSLLSLAGIGTSSFAVLTGGNWSYKWYPAAGLSNPFILNPFINGPVKRTYTLVASTPDNLVAPLACRRVIVRVAVEPVTPLVLTIQKTCTSGPLWAIEASVTGASAPENLKWHDCSSGTTWTDSGLSPQQIYVAVWDTETGQYAEEWVVLPTTCPSPPVPPWVWLAALAVILLAVVWFLRFRRNP